MRISRVRDVCCVGIAAVSLGGCVPWLLLDEEDRDAEAHDADVPWSERTCPGDVIMDDQGRRLIVQGFVGRADSHVPGTLAATAIAITPSAWVVGHAEHMELSVEVLSGQSIPGARLVLARAGQPLADAVFGGPRGQAARLDASFALGACGSPCVVTLGLTGVALPTVVGVPVSLEGTLRTVLDSERDQMPCAEEAVHVEVADATP